MSLALFYLHDEGRAKRVSDKLPYDLFDIDTVLTK